MPDIMQRARELLEAGYDNGFGVTSLDTLLSEDMRRAERLDFAAFMIGVVEEQSRQKPDGYVST